MKVYELMAALQEMPAGAKVVVTGYITDKEFEQFENISENETLKRIEQTVNAIEEVNAKNVIIYF